MASFPAIYSGSISLYPLTRTTHRATTVQEFTDFTEQRWKCGPTLEAFELVFEGVRLADMLTIRTFFDGRKGGFDATWDITLAGVTYSHMVFDGDVFETTETAGGLYSFKLPCKQVRA